MRWETPPGLPELGCSLQVEGIRAGSATRRRRQVLEPQLLAPRAIFVYRHGSYQLEHQETLECACNGLQNRRGRQTLQSLRVVESNRLDQGSRTKTRQSQTLALYAHPEPSSTAG